MNAMKLYLTTAVSNVPYETVNKSDIFIFSHPTYLRHRNLINRRAITIGKIEPSFESAD